LVVVVVIIVVVIGRILSKPGIGSHCAIQSSGKDEFGKHCRHCCNPADKEDAPGVRGNERGLSDAPPLSRRHCNCGSNKSASYSKRPAETASVQLYTLSTNSSESGSICPACIPILEHDPAFVTLLQDLGGHQFILCFSLCA
jgi:hypothetical protein